MTRTIWGATLLAGFAAVATPTLAQAQNMETRTYHVVATGRTKALSWTCWFPPPECKYAACHMKTIQEPTLGSLRPRVRAGTIATPGGACDGKPTTVLDLFYTPRRGAHGTDSIVLETHSDNGLNHRLEITVDVP
jgi:hypothetical protein